MLAGMRQVVQYKLQPGQLNCAPPSRRWCHRAAPTRHQRATGVITSPHTRQRSERTNDIAHAPFWRVPVSLWCLKVLPLLGSRGGAVTFTRELGPVRIHTAQGQRAASAGQRVRLRERGRSIYIGASPIAPDLSSRCRVSAIAPPLEREELIHTPLDLHPAAPLAPRELSPFIADRPHESV